MASLFRLPPGAPTALSKMPFDAGVKILPHHLAFAPAADALLLAVAASCPAGMNSCADQKSPNKCCQKGTYCTAVPDASVEHVACCPDGARCGGQVGTCPADATSCPSELGGGCCIAGYVCRGLGCVPRDSAVESSAPTPDAYRPVDTGSGTTSLVVVVGPPPTQSDTPTTSLSLASSDTTIITSSSLTTSDTLSLTTSDTLSLTTSDTATSSDAGTSPGPPWRPTGPSPPPPTTTTTADEPSTQTGCPTGFYGCLATHGGGCCRTDRDCHTHSCPATSTSILIASNGATVVVPGGRSPQATCAGGWFACGSSDDDGCCPSGYQCGSASCVAGGAGGSTGSVGKQPARTSGAAGARKLLLLLEGWFYCYWILVMVVVVVVGVVTV
ncbi:hypothetical protein L249_5083 [Ophiocordyceps polyrhachis-furcata BCC 54312]|uniref:Uncharacterized protein n=1 Tax=Ophiocordyceps polyrhachis-furcata BCC 54312 TaxID=1330021 RepID=A0A367L3S9_9HYPO|nr:hypothetical protein L249_5083 [Ophiocordyceps polyrhachis-furcata BCC 54312]